MKRPIDRPPVSTSSSWRVLAPGSGARPYRDVTPERIGIARQYPVPSPCGCGCSGGCAQSAGRSGAPPVALRTILPAFATRLPGAGRLIPQTPHMVQPDAFQRPQCCQETVFELDPIVYPGEYEALRRAFIEVNADFPSCDRGLVDAFLCDSNWEGVLAFRLRDHCAAIRNCNYAVAHSFIPCLFMRSAEYRAVRAASRADCISAGIPEARCRDEGWRTVERNMLLPGEIDVFAGGGRIPCGSRCTVWAFRGQPCP